jgi:hypothetical protein
MYKKLTETGYKAGDRRTRFVGVTKQTSKPFSQKNDRPHMEPNWPNGAKRNTITEEEQ